jgi:hypothetical protein
MKITKLIGVAVAAYATMTIGEICSDPQLSSLHLLT